MLNTVRFQIGDRSQSFAEVLVNLSNLYSFNPKIMLALLEQQSRLISSSAPSTEQTMLALGYSSDEERYKGLYNQLRWGAIQLRHGLRDYGISAQNGTPLPDLQFADDRTQAASLDIGLARYAVARLLAQTTTPDQLPAKLDVFQRIYNDLFEDPRLPLADMPAPAEPFLQFPLAQRARVTSFFDHDTPFLQQNGSLLAFWGNTDFYSYDGHTGWDYGARPPDPVLAAAVGTVVFAGNSDDGCGVPARAVIIEHFNGYRTLYWHLNSIDVAAGQEVTAGTPIGVAGATGCAFGPHLHFQVQYLGRDVDPYGWCSSASDPWALNPTGQQSVWLWAYMPSPCAPPPDNYIVIDDSSTGFVASGDWQPSDLGYAGSARFTSTVLMQSEAQPWQVRPLATTPPVAVWQPDLPQAGEYRVLAYVPYILNGLDDARAVRYVVHHSGGETEITVDAEMMANTWADLGTYAFDPTLQPRVSVSALSADAGRGIWVDAVAWVPVE
ncbi:MAG: peptidoglycan DD-metalloendopeptidase family protein [Chloroflexaceae bacterium]|nr:peptidoglycan DD-metalloendopeptidase family protein [Chloroflexaceae bacterium]